MPFLSQNIQHRFQGIDPDYRAARRIALQSEAVQIYLNAYAIRGLFYWLKGRSIDRLID